MLRELWYCYVLCLARWGSPERRRELRWLIAKNRVLRRRWKAYQRQQAREAREQGKRPHQ